MKKTHIIPFALLSLLGSAQAAITFQFNYNDAAGTGFNDATYGAERRAALQSAGNLLNNYFGAYNQTVTIDVTSYSNAGSGTLASAGSSAYLINGFQTSFIQNRIQTGGGTGTGSMSWNLGRSWDYDDSVSAGSFDFKAVAMHELLHAFGFTSYINSNGTGLGDHASGTADTWSIFDKFLTDSTGASLINQASNAFDTSKQAALTGGPGMFFAGANAMAANGGSLITIYSPTTWSDGSSGSHLDDATYPGLIMDHATGTGQKSRQLSAIEIGILKDIGYTSIVQEPSTYGLIAGGAAFVMLVARRRRTTETK